MRTSITLITANLSALSYIAVFILLIPACSDDRRTNDIAEGPLQQVLYVNNGAEPEDLDPHVTTGLPESYIIQSLFEGLAAKDPQTLNPIPAVAESWSVSEDLTRYSFTLRNTARWSNGDRVTAGDIVYSWQRLLEPAMASEYAYMLYMVENARAYNAGEITDFNQVGVKAVDDGTLEVSLTTPTPYFLQILDHHSTFPVPRKAIEASGAMDERGTSWTRPGNLVGNGPFRLKEWIPNKVVVVEKNPLYWDADSVRLEEIHYFPVQNKQTEERMFRSGQIDMTLDGQILTDKIEVYRQEQPDHIRINPYLGTYYYLFNTTRPPFDDVRVRRAFSMAIDRRSITENVVKGGRQPAFAFTPPGTAGYTPEDSIKHDPEQARQLLAEAGYPGGEGFPAVELLFNTHNNHEKVATVIQQMWKSTLNVDVILVNQEWKVYLSSRSLHDYDIARAAWLADYVDPSTFLELFTTGSGNNHTGWTDPEYDRLIAEANRVADTERRYKLFQAAERILMEASPVAPIYTEASVNLVNPRVKGIYRNKMTYYPFKYVHLSED